MNDQAMNLRRKVNHLNNPSEKKATTIAIVSGKGGVGKSNFAINFSLQLKELNKRVLLFDLDVGMGNIDILLGLQPNHSIIDMLSNKLKIESIIEKGPKDLSYIAGGSSLTEVFSMDNEKMDYFLAQYDKVSKEYDYIVFDLGAGVSESSMFFTLSSDEIIVITTPEPTSITDAYSMIKHIHLREPNMSFHIVINRAINQKSGMDTLERFLQVVKNFLKIEANKLGVLPNDPIVTEAVMKQTPYTLLSKRAPISKAMKEIVIEYVNENTIKPDRLRGSFVQRLRQFFVGR